MPLPCKSVDSPAVQAELAAALQKIKAAVPGSRAASYASTHDRTFVSQDDVATPFEQGRMTAGDIPGHVAWLLDPLGLWIGRIDGPIGWNHVKAALADEFGKPDGVLRTPKPADFSSISATVATTRWPSWAMPTPMDVPSGEYFAALDSRFDSTCIASC